MSTSTAPPTVRAYAVALTVALAAWACHDEIPTTAPGAPPAPAFEIRDAAHNGGVEGFYFLAPIVKAPTFAGTFDGSLAPVVEICAWTGTTCGTTVARYTTTSGPNDERVRADAASELYIVNWHTDQFALDPALTYRIRVLVDGGYAGHADVDVVEGGNQLKNVETSEYIGLLDGRTLPIKFRIEHGAVFVVPVATVEVTPATATLQLRVSENVQFTAVARDANGVVIPGAVFAWSVSDPSLATIGAAGALAAKSSGALTVSATSGGKVGTAAVVIRPPITQWTAKATNTWNSVFALWGTSAANVYAAGFSLARYDGTAWTEIPGTVPPFAVWQAIWGSSPTNVLVVGSDGNAMRYDGGVPTFLATGTTADLMGLWGSSATNVWAVGEGGTILHFDGAAWAPVAGVTSQGLRGIWGSSASDVYAVGENGTILHYDGAAWSAIAGGTPGNHFYGVWGSSPTDVYVGGNTGVHHFDGTAWSQVAQTQSEVRFIWGAGPKDVWAAATDAVYYYDGVKWISYGPFLGVVGVWGSSPTNVIAATASVTPPAIMHGSP